MMNYVLTITKYGAPVECEVFEHREHALQSAFDYCDMQNLHSERYHPYIANKQCWVIADEYGYFVAVVARATRDDVYYLSDSGGSKLERDFMRNQYAYAKDNSNTVVQGTSIWDQHYLVYPDYSKISISAAQPAYYPTYTGDLKPYLKDITAVNPNPAPPSPPPPPADVHDDMSHPGGFSLSKGTGLTLQEVWNDPYDVINIYDMDEHQQFALAIARARRRPNLKLVINGNSFAFSQADILTELKNKTENGKDFRYQLMEELADLYQGAIDDYVSEESQ